MDIKDLIQRAKNGEDVTSQLREKSVTVPAWSELKKEYDPKLHPVMDERTYPDKLIYGERPELDNDGNPVLDANGNQKVVRYVKDTEKVSRVAYDLQRLAVKRVTELCFGINVRRVYKPDKNDEKQKLAAQYLEKIFDSVRINSVNIERSRQLYASCEIMTLWYTVVRDHNLYGFPAKSKLRVVTYSPMLGDDLYPLFDETGDLIALSVAYTRKVQDKTVSYFDTYTAEWHGRWEMGEGADGRSLVVDEEIKLGKIPAVYRFRPTPAWEDGSPLVYEMEWTVSRNGNYLRKNSRPILMAAVSEDLQFNQAPSTDAAFRDIVQYPQGSTLQYVTWNQAIDSVKFYVYELRQMYFTQLQLPDWSYENMKTSPMSGEARKQLFIDCQLKVKDESGRWIEFFDREVKVVKEFLKQMLGNKSDWNKAIDSLPVENIMTPYMISDDKDTVSLLLMKNGNKPLMSQRESIEALGESEDVDATIAQIQQDEMMNAVEMAM